MRRCLLPLLFALPACWAQPASVSEWKPIDGPTSAPTDKMQFFHAPATRRVFDGKPRVWVMVSGPMEGSLVSLIELDCRDGRFRFLAGFNTDRRLGEGVRNTTVGQFLPDAWRFIEPGSFPDSVSRFHCPE